MGSERLQTNETSVVGNFGGVRLKSKIAKEIADMRKQGTVTATSDVGVFVSLGTLSEDQRARMSTLPAGVDFASIQYADDGSDAGKSTSEFGTAASLLGEARAVAEAPGEFHPLRQNTISRSTPRFDTARSKTDSAGMTRTSTHGPTGFSNAGVLANITSAPIAEAPSSSRRRGSRSDRAGRRGSVALESLPRTSPGAMDGTQEMLASSALPQPPDTARSVFSSFAPPSSARGSAYNSQRSARETAAKSSVHDNMPDAHSRDPELESSALLQQPNTARSVFSTFSPPPSAHGSAYNSQRSARENAAKRPARDNMPEAHSRDPSDFQSHEGGFYPSALPGPITARPDQMQEAGAAFSPAASVQGSRRGRDGEHFAAEGAYTENQRPESRTLSTSAYSARSASRDLQATSRGAPSTSRSTMSLREKVANEIAQRRKAQEQSTAPTESSVGADAASSKQAWTPSFISPPPKEVLEDEFSD